MIVILERGNLLMETSWTQNVSPWIRIDLKEWEPLINGYTPVLYRKKSFLFHEEDPSSFVYIIKSGRVRLTSFRSDGSEKQFFIAEEGCICGEGGCLMRHPHESSAVAIVDTEVYRISSQELELAMKQDWHLTNLIMQVFCRKNSILANMVLELSFTQSLQRIAQLLINLTRQYGTKEESGCRINIRFTHQDVASMINTSRVTVSNIFTIFYERGLLKKEGGCFILCNPEAMEAIATGKSTLEGL